MPRDLPDWIYDRRRELGDRIRDLRLHANLTQEVLAEMTGIDRRTLQRIERGTSDPPYGSLLLIAQALDIPIADLVRG
ncbi:helix-turn-helix domain-containing protein [Streptomyces kebangsaanensis]|uniref:helix-turn-helix domain-containing protein n=1 Tax=Streptomyces kebangsaanensis TaxID=864058 RepID=UPI00093B9CB1|nr:helix-turn-helix transcriptional regulator [Streptomyces kebangsaanensis]